MEIAEHVEWMRVETQSFVDLLDATAPATAVPTCPGWTMRDLAIHTATAHRWATAVIERRAQRRDEVQPLESLGDVPADHELGAWLLAGQARLAGVIDATPPTADFWRFMRDAPGSVAFWARRQAHETTIHRVDANLAAGAPPHPPAVELAADGIDELVRGFAPRYRPTGIDATRIGLHASDAGRDWTVALTDGAVSSMAAADAADLHVTGTAADLYLLLWNRGDSAAVTLDGDAAALDTWRRSITV